MMRKIFIVSMLMTGLGNFILADGHTTITSDILKSYAVQKVATMQQSIKFSNEQAQQLEQAEFQYLLDVQKAENCTLCNTAKRMEKAKEKKEAAVQQILPRDLYLKYQFIENQRLKDFHPQWLPPRTTPVIIQPKDSLRIQ